MKYFEQFNILNINDSNFRNLFYKVYIESIDENQLVSYDLNDYESIKDVAYKVYGDVDLWWVVALLNDVYDLNYDWVLTNEQIENISRELATHDDVLNETEYLENFDELRALSDEKRKIKLIKSQFLPEFLRKFLAEKNDDLSVLQIDESSLFENEIEDDRELSNVNYSIVNGTLYDVTLPLYNTSQLVVYDVEVIVNLSNITLIWKLPPNNVDYQAIWIVDNGESIALLGPKITSYNIQNASVGEHEIHIVLVSKAHGVNTVANVFVALPEISCEVDQQYFETLEMSLYPTTVGGYGAITWDVLCNASDLTFNASTPSLSGILWEKEDQRVTFIATDEANRMVRKRVDFSVNRYPELDYDFSDYNQFDIVSVSPILTYGYGQRVFAIESGALPNGLTLDENTGVISGQILNFGESNFSIRMVDEVNRSVTKSFTVFVEEVPPFTFTLEFADSYTRTRPISIIPSGD